MAKIFVVALSALLLETACGGGGGGGGDGHALQSECVQDSIWIDRHLPDGVSCTNFGSTGCEPGRYASDCIHYCAFDTCQPKECVDSSDCSGGKVCTTCVYDYRSYGKWCAYPSQSCF